MNQIVQNVELERENIMYIEICNVVCLPLDTLLETSQRNVPVLYLHLFQDGVDMVNSDVLAQAPQALQRRLRNLMRQKYIAVFVLGSLCIATHTACLLRRGVGMRGTDI
jgi:hypothetical protein